MVCDYFYMWHRSISKFLNISLSFFRYMDNIQLLSVNLMFQFFTRLSHPVTLLPILSDVFFGFFFCVSFFHHFMRSRVRYEFVIGIFSSPCDAIHWTECGFSFRSDRRHDRASIWYGQNAQFCTRCSISETAELCSLKIQERAKRISMERFVDVSFQISF